MPSPNQTRTDLLAGPDELGRLRLGQLPANVEMTAGRMDAGGVWDLEGEGALAAVHELVGPYAEAESVPI